jgi:aminoglycoside phosphotransferase (APT) family kinase protein
VGHTVPVSEVTRPAGQGLSSVTLLLDADLPGGRVPLVARMPPDDDAFPVFPHYDLRRQYEVIAAVAAHTHVPLPALYWMEDSPEALGRPFFVMERLEGRTPSDNPPYVFAGWLLEASAEEQRALQDASIELLAAVHALPCAADALPEMFAEAAPDPLRHLVEAQRAYYEWSRRGDGLRIPVIEDAFAWLEEHWPANPGEPVLCWGDARPGNILFDGFRPVAALDWEMCAIAPREVDLAWMLFLHRFFQDIAEMVEFPGLPDLFRRADVVACYERASGHTVCDLDFYLVVAAVRHAVVMSQIKRRMIHFGEDTVPATPDEYVLFHAALRAILDGSYDWAR